MAASKSGSHGTGGRRRTGRDTCWIRVAQNWAGAGWGGQIIPRIGMEVMVTHLDGDPDRPLVTGVVPNARQKVPYKLPEHKTRSTFKTKTHKGYGFNELRFEDKTNEEEIRVIAQKDMNTMIRNNESRIVMKNSATAVMDNKLSEVLGDSISSVTGTFTLYTGPSGITALAGKGLGASANILSESANSLDRPMFANDGAPGDLTIISDGSHNVTIRESAQYHIGENYDMSVLKNHAVRVEENQSNSVAKSQNNYVGKFRTEQIGEKYIVFCGSSRIEIDKDGNIKIKGKNIDLEASENIRLRAKRIDMN